MIFIIHSTIFYCILVLLGSSLSSSAVKKTSKVPEIGSFIPERKDLKKENIQIHKQANFREEWRMETGGRRAHRWVVVGLPPAAAESGQDEEAAARSHADSGPTGHRFTLPFINRVIELLQPNCCCFNETHMLVSDCKWSTCSR